MQIFLTYIITVIFSFLIDFYLEMKVAKDLFDNGYKFVDDNGYSIYIKLNNTSILVPIFNIIAQIQNYIDYNNRPYVLSELDFDNAIEPLTEFEQKLYNYKPNGLTAILMPIKIELIKKDSEYIKISENDYNGEIYYDTNASMDDIDIIDKTDDFENLSDYKIKQILVDNWIDTALIHYKNDIDLYNNKENERQIFDVEIDDNLPDLNLSYEEKRKILTEFREKIVQESEKRNENKKLSRKL